MKIISEYLNSKNFLIVFLIIFIGVCCPIYSGKMVFNFWSNLCDFLTDPLAIICVFIASTISIFKYIRGYNSKIYIINRFNSFSKYTKYYIKDIVVMSVFIYFVFIILGIAGSILISFNNFSIGNYIFYNISYIIYIPFLILRELILFILINIIIYYIILSDKRYLSYVILITIISLFYIVTEYKECINNFYDMYLLYPYYFLSIKYQSFLLEIICSIIEIFIVYGITKITCYLLCRKKRDIL